MSLSVRLSRFSMSVSMSISYTLLNKKFSEEGVGMCEEMGLQHISELFTTDGGRAQVCRQRVPDDGGCNMEAPLTEPGPGPRNQQSQHVTAFSPTEVCPPRDVSDRHTVVPEVGWAGAADTVRSSYGHLVRDPLAHWQPMKHNMKNWDGVLKLAGTDENSNISFLVSLSLDIDCLFLLRGP